MSQGSQVADKEYREIDWLTVSIHTNEAPHHHHTSPFVIVAFTTPTCFWRTVDLAPWGNKSSVMVSVTLILEAFEYVALNILLIMECLLGNYDFLPISPWWVSWFPSKWPPSGKGLLLGVPLKGHHTIPTHTCHFLLFLPLYFPNF